MWSDLFLSPRSYYRYLQVVLSPAQTFPECLKLRTTKTIIAVVSTVFELILNYYFGHFICRQ